MSNDNTYGSDHRPKSSRDSLTIILVLTNLLVLGIGLFYVVRVVNALVQSNQAAKEVSAFAPPKSISWQSDPIAPPIIAMSDSQAKQFKKEVANLSIVKERFDQARRTKDLGDPEYLRGLLGMLSGNELGTAERLSCLKELGETTPHPFAVSEVEAILIRMMREPSNAHLLSARAIAMNWFPDPSNPMRQQIDRMMEAEIDKKMGRLSHRDCISISLPQPNSSQKQPIPSSKLTPGLSNAGGEKPGLQKKTIVKQEASEIFAELNDDRTTEQALAKVRGWGINDPRRPELVLLAIAQTKDHAVQSIGKKQSWIDHLAIYLRDPKLMDALFVETTQTPRQKPDPRLLSRQMCLALADRDVRWVTGILQSLPKEVPSQWKQNQSQRTSVGLIERDAWVDELSAVLHYLTETDPELISPWIAQDSLQGFVARRTLVFKASWTPSIVKQLGKWLNETIQDETKRDHWIWIQQAIVDKATRDLLTEEVLAIKDERQRSRAFRWWLHVIDPQRDLELAARSLRDCSSSSERLTLVHQFIDLYPGDHWNQLNKVLDLAEIQIITERNLSDDDEARNQVVRQIDAKLVAKLIYQELPKGIEAYEVVRKLGGPLTASVLASEFGNNRLAEIEWSPAEVEKLIGLLSQRGSHANE